MRDPVRLDDDLIRKQARSLLAVVLVTKKRDLLSKVPADVCPAEDMIVFIER